MIIIGTKSTDTENRNYFSAIMVSTHQSVIYGDKIKKSTEKFH